MSLSAENQNTDIHCELLAVSLELQTSYDALSYTWEGNLKDHTIRIGDAQLRITANLHGALINLRLKNASRLLWVDAICINQENIPERNQQVKFMSKIYSLASEVILWLGREDWDVRNAFSTISSAYKAVKEYGDK